MENNRILLHQIQLYSAYYDSIKGGINGIHAVSSGGAAFFATATLIIRYLDGK